MASGAPTVKAVSSCIVTPSSPTPPHHMFLAAADIMWRWFPYNQGILFFKLEHPHSASSLIQHLKTSLALALVDFFPFAGRLFQQANGRLTLDCNDAGVPFIEASIDLPFSCLEADGFQHKPFFQHLAPHGDDRQWTGPELPLLSVQVTRFPSDEGLVVGIGHLHAIADGSSFWHFMMSWGECARGLPISVRPLHMREELGPEKLILPPAPQAPDDQANFRSVAQGGKYDTLVCEHELAQCNFHFTAEMVKKLKHMADSSCPNGHTARFSSLQALSAHIWKHVVVATGLEKGKKSAFCLIANMRTRLVPPLPEAYFGNAILRGAIVATSEDLQEESLGATATRMQELIKSLDDKSLKIFHGNLEAMDPSKINEGFDVSMLMLQVSNSHHFPVYDVDFGWGQPLFVQCPRINNNGEMMWFPGREGGGSVDVSFALTNKTVMHTLGQDEGFLSF